MMKKARRASMPFNSNGTTRRSSIGGAPDGADRRPSFSQQDKMAAMLMHKSASESDLRQREPEHTTEFFHEPSGEKRVRIEIEGDGPLGIQWLQDEDTHDIIIDGIVAGTCAGEFKELEDELLLREINGQPLISGGGSGANFRTTMQTIGKVWRADNLVTLTFARAPDSEISDSEEEAEEEEMRLTPRSTARRGSISSIATASGPPSLAAMVRIKDDGVGTYGDDMSPIHESFRKGETPRSKAMSVPMPPPELSLEGMDATVAPRPSELAPTAGGNGRREQQLLAVQQFLRDLNAEHSYAAWVEFGVSTMEDLVYVEPEDLPSFGLAPLQQRRVAAAIAAMQSAAVPERKGMGMGMCRSPSQVFESPSSDDELEQSSYADTLAAYSGSAPPPLSLEEKEDPPVEDPTTDRPTSSRGSDVNVYISPFLDQGAKSAETARIQQKYAENLASSRAEHEHDVSGYQARVHQLASSSDQWTSSRIDMELLSVDDV